MAVPSALHRRTTPGRVCGSVAVAAGKWIAPVASHPSGDHARLSIGSVPGSVRSSDPARLHSVTEPSTAPAASVLPSGDQARQATRSVPAAIEIFPGVAMGWPEADHNWIEARSPTRAAVAMAPPSSEMAIASSAAAAPNPDAAAAKADQVGRIVVVERSGVCGIVCAATYAGGTPHEVPAGNLAAACAEGACADGGGEPRLVPQAETTTATMSPSELARRRIGRVYRPAAGAQFSSFETSRTAPLSADVAIAA